MNGIPLLPMAVVAAGGALMAAAVVGWMARRSLGDRLRSLSILEAATHRIKRGDYSSRIKLDSKDAFAPLANAFNDMTGQLASSFRTIQSVADIDRLILSGTGLSPVIRKVLTATGRIPGVVCRLVLRASGNDTRLVASYFERGELRDDQVNIHDLTADMLEDVDGYALVAERLCLRHPQAIFPVLAEGKITGVMVVESGRALESHEEKLVSDLTDRLSVAVTNIRRSESLYEQAHFDSLTGLINRQAFEDRLAQNISRSNRGEPGAALFIDLDGFKKVNDTEGHKAGDRLLVLIGERISSTLREVDTTARLGGDEFGVIVPGCDGEKALSDLCRRLVEAVGRPIVVERIEHSITASIGVAVFPHDGRTVEDILMKADAAMYRAKESGGARFAFFDDSLNQANRHRVLVESRLRRAIKRDELELYFQPKLHLESGLIDSAEGLIRWNDTTLGTVAPDVFVPIAEETNLIHDFSAILVAKTAQLFRAAEARGVELRRIALNASTRQIMSDGFALSLLSLMDRFNVAHDRIEIEVTESIFAKDKPLVTHELSVLREAGVRIALDDFGTGYSSLNMLRELPLDVVKIDSSFVTELENSDEARQVMEHLIGIAVVLGKQVVAEGVEDDVQLRRLAGSDCHYAQGYLISKALPPDAFLQLVEAWSKEKRLPVPLTSRSSAS